MGAFLGSAHGSALCEQRIGARAMASRLARASLVVGLDGGLRAGLIVARLNDGLRASVDDELARRVVR